MASGWINCPRPNSDRFDIRTTSSLSNLRPCGQTNTIYIKSQMLFSKSISSIALGAIVAGLSMSSTTGRAMPTATTDGTGLARRLTPSAGLGATPNFCVCECHNDRPPRTRSFFPFDDPVRWSFSAPDICPDIPNYHFFDGGDIIIAEEGKAVHYHSCV